MCACMRVCACLCVLVFFSDSFSCVAEFCSPLPSSFCSLISRITMHVPHWCGDACAWLELNVMTLRPILYASDPPPRWDFLRLLARASGGKVRFWHRTY